MIVGVVLAHGRSFRFGSEKALAKLGDETLMARAANCLATIADKIAVNTPLDSETATAARARGWPVLPDAPEDPNGPLAGVKAALTWAQAEGAAMAATAPCDAPLLPAELYPRLAAAIGTAPAAAPRTSDGAHPLCALWRIEALPALEAASTGGSHPSVRAFLSDIHAAFVDFPNPEAFANVNTREDLTHLAEALRQGLV